MSEIYRSNNIKGLLKLLIIIPPEVCVFIVLQWTGLNHIQIRVPGLIGSIINRDIVLIVVFHTLFLILVGIYSLWKVYFIFRSRNDPVNNLIFFTSKREERKLKLLKTSWNYLIYLWLFIYVY